MWFERKFDLGLSVDSLPDLLERLRGTPLRLEERASRAGADMISRRVGGAWSILEHVGHLVDLEPLWLGRVQDFSAGADVLRPADLENRATWDANHNARALPELLDAFSSARAALLSLIGSLDAAVLDGTALHPRLEQPMTVADLSFFVAEHDDHHLAAITELTTKLVPPI